MGKGTDNVMREALGDFFGLLEYKARHGTVGLVVIIAINYLI